jgi:TatA/E family protein of Tat protein translocase
MGGFGFSGEMVFIFFLALILFGPKKMPEIGRQVARFLGEFRRASNEFRSQIETEINALDSNSSGKPRQQGLPSLQAPLGSLASRIFNPPAQEKLEAAEAEAAEAEAVKTAAAESVAAKAAVESNAVRQDEPASIMKAAPDA